MVGSFREENMSWLREHLLILIEELVWWFFLTGAILLKNAYTFRSFEAETGNNKFESKETKLFLLKRKTESEYGCR